MLNVFKVLLQGIPRGGIGVRERMQLVGKAADLSPDKRLAVAELQRQGMRATIISNIGETTVRLGDFEGVPLWPSLHPGAIDQTFVSGPVLVQAEKVLECQPSLLANERTRAIEASDINWGRLPFDFNMCDAMYVATSTYPGYWAPGQIFPYENIEISPSAAVLHYGQGIFEGLKVYISAMGRLVAFRPQDNAKRMMAGSKRMCMNPVPVDFFLKALKETVLANLRLVPPRGTGAAMYVRPFEFGSDPRLGVGPAARDTFAMFVSPVGPYFKGGFDTIKLVVVEEFHRSAQGIVGMVKAIGNYAAGMFVAKTAKGKDPTISEVIYLDTGNKHIEEVGAANFFAIVKDGDKFKLVTPRLSGTILPGITRDSVIQLARALGMEVLETDVPIKEVVNNPNFVGAFCTGTAAVISPIGSIEYKGKTKVFNSGVVHPVAEELYKALTAIQQEVWAELVLQKLPADFIEMVKREWICVLLENV